MDHDRPSVREPLSLADQAFLLAVRHWGGTPGADFWRLFRPDRRQTLRRAWEAGAVDPDAARERLQAEHRAQAACDPHRVHPSWWARALQNEPPSVRAAVLSGLDELSAGALREALVLPADGPTPDRPPAPAAVRLARTLWSERLVGDVAVRDDDPPVIAAVTRFDPALTSRVFLTIGLAKWAVTPRTPDDLRPHDADRLERLRVRLRGQDARFVTLSTRDTAQAGGASPRPAARLGLLTVARLLAEADPFRARWAVQHLPYPMVRTLRKFLGPPSRRSPTLARWESPVLRAAWQELHEEGWITDPYRWGDRP